MRDILLVESEKFLLLSSKLIERQLELGKALGVARHWNLKGWFEPRLLKWQRARDLRLVILDTNTGRSMSGTLRRGLSKVLILLILLRLKLLSIALLHPNIATDLHGLDRPLTTTELWGRTSMIEWRLVCIKHRLVAGALLIHPILLTRQLLRTQQLLLMHLMLTIQILTGMQIPTIQIPTIRNLTIHLTLKRVLSIKPMPY